MNPLSTLERSCPLRPDRFGSALARQPARRGSTAAASARRSREREAATAREWVVAMAVALAFVALVFAVKFALFLAIHADGIAR